MDEDKLKAIIKEAINGAVDPIKQMLSDPDTGLKRLNERIDSNTAAIMELEKTVKGYGDMYKINDANVRKVEKRVETLKENAGIESPQEFTLADVS